MLISTMNKNFSIENFKIVKILRMRKKNNECVIVHCTALIKRLTLFDVNHELIQGPMEKGLKIALGEEQLDTSVRKV